MRFITSEPSLVDYSGTARAELSTVKDGEESYEIGAAFGGPIASDKEGLRLSALSQHTGGYIDLLDPYNNGWLVYKDANSSDTLSVRGRHWSFPAALLGPGRLATAGASRCRNDIPARECGIMPTQTP